MKMVFYNLAGWVKNRSSGIAVLLCLFFPITSAQAVEVRLPTGIIASANFLEGRPTQPAVLLLHGFLQTDHSEPMNSLALNLHSKGYTTLSPTISLGVNQRKQSMACEAVHTHTIADGVAEVAYWVNWLSQKGYKNIVLIGFSSTGNNEVLLFNAQGAHPAIKKSILVSPNPAFQNRAEFQKIRSADAKRNSDARKLGIFSLGYCKNNFASTAKSYLSYAQYDNTNYLKLIRQTPVETEVIIGSADTILPANWISQIKALKTRVTIIDKGTHFFDGSAEFDLADKVEYALKNIPAD